MREEIVSNKVKCLKCGDIIESHHRHDDKYCSCSNVLVDGGKDYLRRGYKSLEFEELTTIRRGGEITRVTAKSNH